MFVISESDRWGRINGGENVSADACIGRNNRLIETTLAAGTYHLVVDTYVPYASEPAIGRYQLSVVECNSIDSACVP